LVRKGWYCRVTDGFRDIEKLESDLWEAAGLAEKIQKNFEELGV